MRNNPDAIIGNRCRQRLSQPTRCHLIACPDFVGTFVPYRSLRPGWRGRQAVPTTAVTLEQQ